jgi:hypothetical protein
MIANGENTDGNHPDTLRSMNNLAGLYDKQGHSKKARSLREEYSEV